MEEVKISQFKGQPEDEEDYSQQVDEQVEVQMLAQQCQELINRLGSYMQPSNILDQPEPEQSLNEQVTREKNRLEKQYMELCVQIERQQKELDNYKFKIKVSNKEAEYYSRQIKEKEQILANLEKHQHHGSGKKNSQKTARR